MKIVFIVFMLFSFVYVEQQLLGQVCCQNTKLTSLMLKYYAYILSTPWKNGDQMVRIS